MYLPVYPKPTSMVESSGSFALPLKAEMRISVGAMDEARKDLVCDMWYRFACTAAKLVIVEDAGLPAHTAVIGCAECACNETDDYAITVTESGVCLKGKDDLGLLRGCYTLLQLIRPVCLDEGSEDLQIDCVVVHDRPALGMRAIHFCLFPETTLDVLEKTIRLAAFMKYTHFVLEPWGALKLDSFPELAWAECSYSKDEIKPYLKLCNTMGMEVIPMINHLGHATQSRGGMGRHTVLDQNPRLSLMFEPDGWTWCLSNPMVHEKLRAVREELIDLCGEGSYFHLGCDESYSYASCPKCRQQDHIAMLADYLNGLCEELAQKGRRAIIWHDQLLDRTAWEHPLIATSRPDQKTHLALEKLDRRLLIADWQYNITTPELPTSEYFVQQGFDVLICPWDKAGNAVAMHAGADKLGLMGAMDTTWHHMDPMLRGMLEYGGSIWNGANYEANPGQGVHCAAILRKIMPHARSFAKSGFLTHEIDPNYCRILYGG